MRRIPTLIETVLFGALSIFGLYIVYEGAIGQDVSYVTAGALCFVLGGVALVMAIRNFLWHRQMLRHSSVRSGKDAGE